MMIRIIANGSERAALAKPDFTKVVGSQDVFASMPWTDAVAQSYLNF